MKPHGQGRPSPSGQSPAKPTSGGHARAGLAPGALAPGGTAPGGAAIHTLTLDGLAASTAGPARYAPLRGQPVCERAGEWLVARPDDVDAALASGALTVVPAGEPGGAARRLQARMARFSDGAAHARRRALAEALLPAAADAEQAAWSMTSATVAGWRGRRDAMDVARRVPVAVLAAALGVEPADVTAMRSHPVPGQGRPRTAMGPRRHCSRCWRPCRRQQGLPRLPRRPLLPGRARQVPRKAR
jgi:hypothetical protein